MNKSLNKYGKLHYKNTRYGIRLISRIKFLRGLYAAQITVAGIANKQAISSAFCNTPAILIQKKIAIANVAIDTYKAINDMYESNPLPKWAKNAS